MNNTSSFTPNFCFRVFQRNKFGLHLEINNCIFTFASDLWQNVCARRYWCVKCMNLQREEILMRQLQMLLFPNALCCSLYESNCVCVVTKIFKIFLPANNFCQLLRVTRRRSCTSAGNPQAQLHFRDDQQRAFGISNISNCMNLQGECIGQASKLKRKCIILLQFSSMK